MRGRRVGEGAGGWSPKWMDRLSGRETLQKGEGPGGAGDNTATGSKEELEVGVSPPAV